MRCQSSAKLLCSTNCSVGDRLLPLLSLSIGCCKHESSVGFNVMHLKQGNWFANIFPAFMFSCVFCRIQRSQRSCQWMANKGQQASLSGIRKGSSGSRHLGTALREGKETKKVSFSGLIWSCFAKLRRDFWSIISGSGQVSRSMVQSTEIGKLLCTWARIDKSIFCTVRVNDSSVIYSPLSDMIHCFDQPKAISLTRQQLLLTSLSLLLITTRSSIFVTAQACVLYKLPTIYKSAYDYQKH